MRGMRSVATRGDLIERRIQEQWTERRGRRLDVLIAGCGWPDPLHLEMESRVVGIDEDHPAARASVESRGDLTSWALGDLRAVPVPPRSFDVVYAPFLLERLEHPELVLDRLVAGLRLNGLLLLRVRDRDSAYGTCARLTPWPLRRLLWHRIAGEDAPEPLPKVYGPAISRAGIHAYCLTRGLVVTDEFLGTSGPAADRPLVRAACTVIEAVSRGRIPASHDEITMIIRKPEDYFTRLL
ncbi:class I SAM-dependent methyltransferase [Planomonospora corallina]|uniref:Class I SAM-dependent methyltransferase n=1 Tax=Planomonospora corallina TaxID=1806052 RepID=A0ABV8I2P3_9ACTN